MYDAKQMHELINDINEREKNKDIYDAVKNMKKLTVYELQELIMPIIKNIPTFVSNFIYSSRSS